MLIDDTRNHDSTLSIDYGVTAFDLVHAAIVDDNDPVVADYNRRRFRIRVVHRDNASIHDGDIVRADCYRMERDNYGAEEQMPSSEYSRIHTEYRLRD